MSSELRSYRMNKANGNGTKLANGRKRIRAVSDSSDDEHETKQFKKIQNGSTATSLSVDEKEARFRQLKEKFEDKMDDILLQDVLVQNKWDIDIAYSFLMGNPNYENSTKTYENAASYSNGNTKSFGKSKTKKVISMIVLILGNR